LGEGETHGHRPAKQQCWPDRRGEGGKTKHTNSQKGCVKQLTLKSYSGGGAGGKVGGQCDPFEETIPVREVVHWDMGGGGSEMGRGGRVWGRGREKRKSGTGREGERGARWKEGGKEVGKE